jgi:protein ImuB
MVHSEHKAGAGFASPRKSPARVACVDIPTLPLQLLLQSNPDWKRDPVAVVDDDSPQGRLMWVNAEARKQRILPGMRFAAARTLATTLRARVVSRTRIDEAVSELFTTLHDYSPRVEPLTGSPGVFFLDPTGLSRLYGSVEQWSMMVHQVLSTRAYKGAVIVGYHRFRCHAIARVHSGCWVLPSPRREASMAATVPLDRLDLSAALRNELSSLEIHTLGQFMALPSAELRLRFGEAAERLHQRASDSAWTPLQARALVDPITATLHFEPPESNHERLAFRLKPAIESLMKRLGEKSQAMSALAIGLSLDHAGLHTEQLEPASPILDAMQVLELIRLRLNSVQLAAPIESIALEAEGVEADQRQMQLFRMQQRRDIDSGQRALARIRALYGNESVTRARFVAAHLPEASFRWEPTHTLQLPRTQGTDGSSIALDSTSSGPAAPPLIRRLFSRPFPLPSPQRIRLEAWVIEPHGCVTALHGPFRVSGGWWVRTVERDYYYAETQSLAILWIYYDRPRRRWYLHGEVD